MANKFVIPFLVAMMILTGVCNTLLTKYQVGLSLSSEAFSKLTDLRICNVYVIAIQAFQRNERRSLNQSCKRKTDIRCLTGCANGIRVCKCLSAKWGAG